MIPGLNPVLQAGLGTLFTWALTAAGSALVFVFSSGQPRVLDGSLGFAAGVMTAASYWSLLAPAIEMAEQSKLYGDQGQWAFIPVAIGFFLGAVFVYEADILMPYLGVNSDPTQSLAFAAMPKYAKEEDSLDMSIEMNGQDPQFYSAHSGLNESNSATRRRGPVADQTMYQGSPLSNQQLSETAAEKQISWRRIVLLIIAITVHNIPEGLAVGVGFGAVGKTPSATFENARNLAIGIGIQNFPEGLAVSLPLRGSGLSVWRSFWYGQLSGMVEPVAGILGALATVVAEPILPYALAFAAGAMIYVVVDDIIPEAQTRGNGKLASWGAVVGFIVMMSLDVGLG